MPIMIFRENLTFKIFDKIFCLWYFLKFIFGDLHFVQSYVIKKRLHLII